MAVTTYTREQVYEASLTYFNGDALAAGVFTDKYALRDREGRYYELTPDDMHRRLAREFARIEAKYPNPLSEHFIYQHLKNFSYIVPQGSPMFGIGNNFQLVSTSNCAVVESPQDTMSSIFDAARDMANLYKRRFGVGIDISNLRPAGAPVNNAAVTSTGAWSFADFYSYVTRMVGQSGRRGALMITLDVRHPDIEHFITMKADLTKVTGANVSVKVSDDFMRAVENDEEYVLHFPVGAPPGQRTFERVVRARDIFKLIAKTANDTAEPGFLYWDTITRNLPLDNYEGFKTVSTNPCLRGDTLLLTNRGLLPIAEVAQLGSVKLWTPAGWREAKAWSTGVKEIVKVTLSNGQEIYTTPDHRFAVGDEWVEAKDLLGKQITPMLGNGDWEGVDPGIEEMDLIRLGFIQGDGSFRKDCSGIIVNVGESDEEVDHLFAAYTQHSDRTRYIPANDKLVALVDWLEMDRSILPERTLPKKLWTLNAQAVRSFLKGMFSANGCVIQNSGSARISFKSTSKKLVAELQMLLLALGYRPYITTNRPKNIEWSNGTYTSRESYDLNISRGEAEKFLEEIGFIQSYKTDALRQIVPNRKGRRLNPTVVSVEPAGTAEVFDFTVLDECHSGWANGMLVHNCGEIPLCGNDSCRLISIYLPAFVENPFEEGKASFNFRRLYDTARVAMRLADDLVDLELEKLHAIRDQADTEDEKRLFTKFIEACEKGRRTGLGTHGLGDALARLRLRYDSEEALKMADKIYMTIKFAAYRESVEMARDRGPFPIWDWEVEKDCEFFQRMAEEQLDIEGVRYRHGINLIADMMKYGRRNGAILTNAPTGSVSILSGNCSSGIEPVFRNSYVRRRKVDASMKAAGIVPDFVDATGDEWVHYTVYHPNVQMYREKFGLKDDDPLPDFFVTADQIDPIMRVRMQATIQRHIDHSLSSTLNLPRETTPDVVEKIYMEAWKLGCKGVTVYRDGSRDGVLVESVEGKGADDKEFLDKVAALEERIVTLEKEREELLATVAVVEKTAAAQQSRLTHRGPMTRGCMFKATFHNLEGEERKVYVYIGLNDYGDVVEVFVTDEQGDEENRAYASATAKLASMALKYGIPVEEVEEALRGLKGASIAYESYGTFNSVPDMIAKLINYMRREEQQNRTDTAPLNAAGYTGLAKAKLVAANGTTNDAALLDTGMIDQPQVSIPGARKCPQCKQRTLIEAGGCPACQNCGYAKCS